MSDPDAEALELLREIRDRLDVLSCDP